MPPDPRYKKYYLSIKIVRARIKYFISLLIIVGIVVAKYSLPRSAYPSLDIQRTVLNNKPALTPIRILDSAQIIEDLRFLSSDSCEGRQPGTKGHFLSAERILIRFRETGIDSFNNSLVQQFYGRNLNGSLDGKNIIGWIKGTRYPEQYIVISAHYDHVGKTATGEIYHGASDNASGVACLLALAKFFKDYPQQYSLIFAAFDREESGLEGSFYFVNQAISTGNHLDIKFNLNIDMITRNDKNEIFACGITHYPFLYHLVKKIQKKTNVKLLMGHDKGKNREDWTRLSDHFPFHLKHIPFIYIGTEDHPDYHKPSDTFDKIDLGTYIENCNMVALLAEIIKI